MKKVIFVFASLIIVLSFIFVNPVQASNLNKFPTKTQIAHKTATPQPTQTQIQPTQKATERAEVTFYTAIWNSCLTVIVEQQSNITGGEANIYCKHILQIAIDNNFYKYRHSDMFQPLPSDIVIP